MRPGASAPDCRDRGQTRRRRNRTRPPTADADFRRVIRWDRADRGTTATAADLRRCPERPPAERRHDGQRHRPRRRRLYRRRPWRCWWCRDRCQRRNAMTTFFVPKELNTETQRTQRRKQAQGDSAALCLFYLLSFFLLCVLCASVFQSLWKFDLRRLQYEFIESLRRRRHLDFAGAPAGMNQRAAERRFAG